MQQVEILKMTRLINILAIALITFLILLTISLLKNYDQKKEITRLKNKNTSVG